jgi:hypothetical protein
VLNSPPLWLFAVGIICGELYQQWQWIVRHPGAKWRGYWKVGVPHLLGNSIVIVGTYVLWSAGLLDKAINAVIPEKIAGVWSNVGIPFTPQVGFFVGAGADVFGDQVAYMIRLLIGRWWPSTASTIAPASTPAAPQPPVPAPPGP